MARNRYRLEEDEIAEDGDLSHISRQQSAVIGLGDGSSAVGVDSNNSAVTAARSRNARGLLSSNASSEEQPSYTVEEAVEQLGFGRFQIKILCITGIMSAADAMEMLLLSVLGPALRCDWHLTSTQVAIITTVVFAGMLIGAPSWGAVSDKRGRWSVFALSLCLIAYFGLLCSFSPNYFWLITLRGLVGFSIGGAASSFTLLSEYLPQKHRAKVLILYNLFWGIGSTFEIVLAYLVLPTLGWRYLVAFSSLPLFLFMLTLGCLPESARYLLASGQTDKAVAVINQIARENRQPPMRGLPAVATINESDRGQLQSLFHPSYRRTSIILFFLWFGVAFSYYGIVLVSTEIFGFHQDCFNQPEPVTVSHNATEAVVDNSCCRILESDDYTAMLISSFGEFVIIPINMLTIDALGRRWTLCINYLLTGFFFGLTYLCVPKAATTAFLFLIRAHAAGIFNTIYIYTSEVYPTVIRSLGLGICSSMARLGSMCTPFVAQVIMPDVSVLLAFIIYVLVDLTCAGLCLLMPIETKGRAMPHSLDQQMPDVVSYSTAAGGESATAEIRMGTAAAAEGGLGESKTE